MKFSHLYNKILDHNGYAIRTAKLLAVLPVKLEDLGQEFLDYDTENGLFELPKKGEYLMLVFQKPSGPVGATNLFTTLRKNTPRKLVEFTMLIGKDVPIELVGEEDKRKGGHEIIYG